MPQQNINNPLVSVVIPCYNNGKYLADALDSVLAQIYSAWECIIVDDGSTDNSKEVALTYIGKDSRFKYIHQQNSGVSIARNNGISNANGKYILPLDADDKIASQYIAEAIEIMEKEPGVKLVYCRAELFGSKSGEWSITPYSYKQLLIENLMFCTALFRKADFDRIAGYDKNMVEGFEDWDFWLSFISESDKVYQIPKTYFYYRIKDISRNTQLDEEKQRRLRRQIYEKHKALYDKHLSVPDVIYDYYKASSQLKEVNQSMTLKVGKFFMAPYHFIRNIF